MLAWALIFCTSSDGRVGTSPNQPIIEESGTCYVDDA